MVRLCGNLALVDLFPMSIKPRSTSYGRHKRKYIDASHNIIEHG